MSKEILKFHPGYYLKDVIDELQMTQDEFAKRLGISSKQITLLLQEAASITPDIAYKLSKLLGTSPDLWLNLQNKYDTALIEEKAIITQEEEKQVYDYIDKAFLTKMNLYKKENSLEENINLLCKALPVSNLTILKNANIMARCKTSSAIEESEKNLVCKNVWISLAHSESKKISGVQKYNEEALRSYIPVFKKLTMEKPSVFYPELVKILKECGVYFVVLPTIKQSNINGFVKWVNNNENVILAMNDRRKTNDVFWFSFFHELHHIFQKSKRNPLESVFDEKTEETGADNYANGELISTDDLNKLTGYTEASIKWLSREIGIHPGIIVGRLQHDKKIEYYKFNNLKEKICVIKVEENQKSTVC